MAKQKNKKGSVTVFIMIFFVSLVSLIFAFIQGSKTSAVSGASDSLLNLWGNSILAEYDLNLQGRYNILGFYGAPADINKKINFYANTSFSGKKYIDYNGCSCSLYDYSLINTKVFRKQIVDAGKFVTADEAIDGQPKIKKVIAAKCRKGSGADNGTIFEDLPSHGSSDGLTISGLKDKVEGIDSAEDVIKKGTNGYFENKYLLAYFKNRSDDDGLGETYLNSEIEYVICGNKSDSANDMGVRLRIIAMREVLNYAYLHKDPAKNAEALAAAVLISPGPQAALVKELLMAGWALLESNNDYELLINGHSISMVKTAATWAVDLDSVINNIEKDCIFTGIDEGEDYEDYLSMMLAVMDDNVKALRMMDLIQINMRHLYYEDFLLSDYSGGLRVTTQINGRDYTSEKEY